MTWIRGTFWALKCLLPSNWTDQLTWASCRVTVGPPSTRPWPGWDKSGQEKYSPPSDVQTSTHLLTCCHMPTLHFFHILSSNFLLVSPHILCTLVVLLKCLCLDWMSEGMWGWGVAANYKCWLPGARTSSWGQDCQRDRISIITISPRNIPQFLSLT